MKQVTKITLITGAVMALVGGGLAVAGYAQNPAYAISWHDGVHVVRTVADTKTFTETELKGINVDATNAYVHITRGATLSVRTVSTTNAEQAPAVKLQDGVLTVKSHATTWDGLNVGFMDQTPEIVITVPEGMNAGDVTISQDNAKVSLQHVSANNVTVTTTNSYIELDDLTAAKVDLRSENGRLSVEHSRFESLKAANENASVDLEDLTLTKGGTITNENAVVDVSDVMVAGWLLTTGNGSVSFDDRSYGNRYEQNSADENTLRISVENGHIEAETNLGSDD